MAGKWDGFTEDDIKKLGVKELMIEAKDQHLSSSTVRVAKRQANLLKSSGKKNIVRERMLQSPQYASTVPVSDIPENALLSKPKKLTESKSISEKLPLISEVSSDSGCGVSNGVLSSTSVSSSTSSADTSPGHGPVYLRIKEGKSYEVLTSDKCSLDEFQSRQKMMEEQNRRRKELLAKALADRKQQTHAEARRLQQIQDELQKLDILLSNDVGILRNQIEVSSFEFMEAQKRYNKAEKEFLDAKLCLFGKLERKELLTEHLCTIIEQNEMRKARKLSELMDKLELGTSIELPEVEQKSAGGSVILSPLCALDEVSNSACDTLKDRKIDAETVPPADAEQVQREDKVKQDPSPGIGSVSSSREEPVPCELPDESTSADQTVAPPTTNEKIESN